MKTRVLVVLSVLLLATTPLFAPIYMNFMRIEGIDGESQSAGHLGWIELESFSFGAPRTFGSATGGAGAGKVEVHDFSVTKLVDKASPRLLQAAATGKHFKSVVLDVSGQRTMLEDVIITSVQPVPAGNDAHKRREEIRMSFARDLTHSSSQAIDMFHKNEVNTVQGKPNANDAYLKYGYKEQKEQKQLTNATITDGTSAPVSVLLKSIRPMGQGSLILVCTPGGQGLQSFQRAFQTKQKLANVSINAQNPNPGGQPYLRFDFQNVLVSSMTLGDGGCTQMSWSWGRGPATGYEWIK